MKTKSVDGHKGIRVKENGKYIVTKHIEGQRFTKEFSLKKDAITWKREYHPLVNPTPRPGRVIDIPTEGVQINGRDRSITFREVIERYEDEGLRKLELSTRHRKMLRMKKFLPSLYSVKMGMMSPSVISRFLKDIVTFHDKNSPRCNFDKELKDLCSVFNWYKRIDFTFINPVMEDHYDLGRIKDIIPKPKVLTVEQFLNFTDCLEEPFQTLAIVQLYLAGRIQEAAALNTRTVDFLARTISITEKIVWIKGAPVHRIGTKTGAVSVVEMNDDMYQRLRTLNELRPQGCKFFFNKNGKPFRYDMIRIRYNEALAKAGLSEFSGTNILRHTMATLSRKIAGADASQAMLRHTSMRMTEGYAKLDVNEKVSKVVIDAEAMFREKRLQKSHNQTQPRRNESKVSSEK